MYCILKLDLAQVTISLALSTDCTALLLLLYTV